MASPTNRGKGLARRVGLKTRKPLQQHTELQQRTSIAPIGPRKQRERDATADTRTDYLQTHPICEIGFAFSQGPPEAKRLFRQTCRQAATACHERQKRSQQGSLVDPFNLMSACGPCNTLVEDEPELAHQLGCVVRSYEDPAVVPVQRMEFE